MAKGAGFWKKTKSVIEATVYTISPALRALKEPPTLSDPAAVVQPAMMILLGNPTVGGVFRPLPVQTDRCRVFGGLGDILKVHLRNFPLTLGKTF